MSQRHDDYENAAWYHPGTRQDAELELSSDACLPGRFIVRPSSKPNCLGLTIKEEAGQFTHALLREADDGWSCVVEGVTYTKPSVTELLVSMGNTLLFPSDADAAFGTLVDMAKPTLSPLEQKKLELRRRKAELAARKRKNSQAPAVAAAAAAMPSPPGASAGAAAMPSPPGARRRGTINDSGGGGGGGGGGGENGPPAGAIDVGVVLEDYDAEEPTELTLREGQRLWVFKIADDWHMGALQSAPDDRKWYPADFVERVGLPGKRGGAAAAAAAAAAPAAAAAQRKPAATKSKGAGDAGSDLGLTDLDLLDDLLDMDAGELDAGLDDDFNLDIGVSDAGSGSSRSDTGGGGGGGGGGSSKKKKQLVQVFYAEDLYTTVALDDSDTTEHIITTLCRKFKFWDEAKCHVFAQMPSGDEKRLKRTERLGATYGPMLIKMRIEVKNERGAFMAITAPGAEARRAAPLPRQGGKKPSGPVPDAGGSPVRLKGEAGLLQAAKSGNVADVVTLLLEGVSPNAKGKEGETPLLLASFGGHTEVVRKLLTAGSSPNHADPRGVTALHVAALQGQIDCVRALLLAGASPKTRSRRGKLPCDVAKTPQIAALLGGGGGGGGGPPMRSAPQSVQGQRGGPRGGPPQQMMMGRGSPQMGGYPQRGSPQQFRGRGGMPPHAYRR